MRCISPIRIKKKGQFLDVPCGKCNFCLSNKKDEWSFRLYNEYRNSLNAIFVTFTYDDDNIPWSEDGIQTLDKIRASKLLKDLDNINRKAKRDRPLDVAYELPTRYYFIGEYGTKTERPHYHGIFYNLHPDTINSIHKKWTEGFVKIGTVTIASIEYVAKYVIEKDLQVHEGRIKPFQRMSKGLGKNYIVKNVDLHKHIDYIRNQKGYKQKMPRYYKNFLETNKNIVQKELDKRKKATEFFEREMKKRENYDPKKSGKDYDSNEFEVKQNQLRKIEKNLKQNRKSL